MENQSVAGNCCEFESLMEIQTLTCSAVYVKGYVRFYEFVNFSELYRTRIRCWNLANP